MSEYSERRVRITFIDPCFGVVTTTISPERVPSMIADLETHEFSIEAIALLEEGE
jgi:hypothetical protein